MPIREGAEACAGNLFENNPLRGGGMDPDFLLIEKMKHGDEKAVEEFVRKYYPAVQRYCFLHIEDRGYAQEAVQETFQRFFGSFERYRHYGKAANYLYVIAGNVCRDYYRNRREFAVEDPEEEADRTAPSAGLAVGATAPTENVELRIDLWEAFARLPREWREVAILFFCQQRRQREIAKILGIGLPLVKYRLGKARERLRELLREVRG